MNSEHKEAKEIRIPFTIPIQISLNTYLANLTGSATLLRRFNFS